jgi:K+-transporting ATPase ATPase C chain
MRRQLLPAAKIFLVFTVLVGLLYPLAMTGAAQVLFGHEANGSMVKDTNGDVVGSSLIGQSFTSAQYFHPRPSAAGDGYDPTKSGGARTSGPPTRRCSTTSPSERPRTGSENGLAPGTTVPSTQ